MAQSMGRVKDFSYFFTLFGFCSVDNLADSLDTSYRLRHAQPLRQRMLLICLGR